MIGQSKTQPLSEGVLAQNKDLPGNLPQRVQFTAPARAPWISEALGHPELATVDTYGRGLLSVSNKVSEVNILNIPIVITVAQLPASTFSRYTPKLMSQNVPVPSQF